MGHKIPIADNFDGRPESTQVVTCKTSDTFGKFQLAVLDTASEDTITATTSASIETAWCRVNEAITSAAAGRTTEVTLLRDGDIIVLVNGSSCTAGSQVIVEGNDGRITDAGATPAVGSVIGRALRTTSTDGHHVPVRVERA